MRLRVDHVTDDGDRVMLLGSLPLELPPPLDELVRLLVDTPQGAAVVGRIDNHPWLLPGGAPGAPLSAKQLMRRLQRLGIRTRPARSTTVIDLASQLPAAVLSRLLGLHLHTAANGPPRRTSCGPATPPTSPAGPAAHAIRRRAPEAGDLPCCRSAR